MKLSKEYPYKYFRPGHLVQLQFPQNNFISKEGERFLVLREEIMLFLGVERLDGIGQEITNKKEVTWFLHSDKVLMGIMTYKEILSKDSPVKVLYDKQRKRKQC